MAIQAIVIFFVPILAAGTLLAPTAGFGFGFLRGGRSFLARERSSYLRMMGWLTALLVVWIAPMAYVLVYHGRQYEGVALAVLPLGLLLFITSLLIGTEYARSGSVPERGHCRRCGYNLHGNVSGICPECGTALHS